MFLDTLYMKLFVCHSVRLLRFSYTGGREGEQTNCLSLGDKHFSHTGATNYYYTYEGGYIFHTQVWGGTNNLTCQF